MTDLSHLEMIPISSLGALSYCPRSFYYQVVQGEMPVNEHMLEGQLALQHAHQTGISSAGGEIKTRRLYSETLHLTGFVDVIEEREGVLIPVEYKHEPGNWQNEHIQLCAQAMCLEERQRGEPPLPYGYIISLRSGRRLQVPFTSQLRAQTRAAIKEALRVAGLMIPPPPLTGKEATRCPNCSLLSICLPEEVRQLRAHQDR